MICLLVLIFNIGQILVGESNLFGVIANAFKNEPHVIKALTLTINVVILVSILGVVNSFVMFDITSQQYGINPKNDLNMNLIVKTKAKEVYSLK